MKSLQQIADIATEAALTATQEPFTIHDRQGQRYFTLASELRLAFAQSVVDQLNPWIPCSERMPEIQDTVTDCVIWWRATSTNAWASVGDYKDKGFATHWMRVPPLPTQEPARCTCTPVLQPRTCPVHGGHEADDIVQPPPNHHLATEDERKCLPVGSKLLWGDEWIDAGRCGRAAANGNIYACPNAPPEPEYVPLDQRDAPPGTAFKSPNNDVEGSYFMPTAVGNAGVGFMDANGKSVWYSWDQLFFDRWTLKRPGEAWIPCRKLKTEGAV
jgi:hypothetical protein